MNNIQYKVGYWANATAKLSGHKSKVGPFETVNQAIDWIIENRSEDDWENIHVSSEYKRIVEDQE